MATTGGVDVLREYLISLGFRTDEKQATGFEKRLKEWDRRATQLGKALAGVATASVAMVATFSYQMEKLYYASRRAESSAGNLKALDFGAQQVGVKNMTQSVEALARNLRSNPGLTGLLNSLGVKVTGRDKSDVMMDLVTQLKKMPFFVSERYANLFGIDADTLFMLQEGLDEWRKATMERQQWAREMGVDTEKAAAGGRELAKEWRAITERAGLFRDVIMLAILPAMKELSSVTQEVLKDWTALINSQPKQGSLLDRLAEGLGLKDTGGGVVLSKQAQERLGQGEGDQEMVAGVDPQTGKPGFHRKRFVERMYDRFMEWGGAKKWKKPNADPATVDAVQDQPGDRPGAPQTQAGITAALRQRMGLGPVLSSEGLQTSGRAQQAMEYFMSRGWSREAAAGIVGNLAKESNFNDRAVGDGGLAYGVAQWHPARQRDFKDWAGKEMRDSSFEEQLAFIHHEMTAGKEREAGNLLRQAQNARDAGAIVSDFYERPKASEGMERGALAERYYRTPGAAGAGAAGAGPVFQQNNTIHVSGVSDADRAAASIGREINQANSDVVRNMKARVQ